MPFCPPFPLTRMTAHIPLSATTVNSLGAGGPLYVLVTCSAVFPSGVCGARFSGHAPRDPDTGRHGPYVMSARLAAERHDVTMLFGVLGCQSFPFHLGQRGGDAAGRHCTREGGACLQHCPFVATRALDCLSILMSPLPASMFSIILYLFLLSFNFLFACSF